MQNLDKKENGVELEAVASRRTFVPQGVKTIPAEAELKFHGVIFDVYQWPQEMFDGTRETFEMLSRADTVKIIAVLNGKIVITKQRQPRKDWFYDYPGGRNDNPQEDELAAAKRELAEETGLIMRNWKLIEVHQPFAKIDWLVYTFLATDLEKQVAQKLDAGEEIEVLEVEFDELKELSEKRDSQYLRFDNYGKYGSLEALLAAPALYEY